MQACGAKEQSCYQGCKQMYVLQSKLCFMSNHKPENTFWTQQCRASSLTNGTGRKIKEKEPTTNILSVSDNAQTKHPHSRICSNKTSTSQNLFKVNVHCWTTCISLLLIWEELQQLFFNLEGWEKTHIS